MVNARIETHGRMTSQSSQRLINYGRLLRRLHSAGFSRRAATTLAVSDAFASLRELKTERWLDDGDRPGLRSRLRHVPGCGPAIIAEVEAFREHGDARKVSAQPTKVTVELTAEVADALDAWIASQPIRVSRAEAVRVLMSESLTTAQKAVARASAKSTVPAL
jgi:hypothetical protein